MIVMFLGFSFQVPTYFTLFQGLGNKFLSHIREVDSILQVFLSLFTLISYNFFMLYIRYLQEPFLNQVKAIQMQTSTF